MPHKTPGEELAENEAQLDIENKRKEKMKKSQFSKWSQQLHHQFIDFVINSQYTRLVQYHSFQNIYTQEWTDNILTFYDLLLNYFLKKTIDYGQLHHNKQYRTNIALLSQTITRLIVVHDDQFRLDIKQYFPSEPLELQVIQLKRESISSSIIQQFYSRQLNIYGFLLHSSNGFIRNNTFQRQQNILLPLYEKQQDPVAKYKDNRIKVMQILVQLPRPYYMEKYQTVQKTIVSKSKQNEVHQVETLESVVSDFINLISIYIPSVHYIISRENQVLSGNIYQILAYFLKMNLTGLFLRFIKKKQNNKEILLSDFNIKEVESKNIDRRIKQIQNYDQNFDLRILQYIYKQQFGFNQSAQKAKTPQDFYQLIPINTISIIQERLRAFKQQISLQRTQDCQHYVNMNTKSDDPVVIYKQILNLLQVFAVQIPDEKQIQVKTGGYLGQFDASQEQSRILQNEESIIITLDYIQCRSCNLPIMCYHQVLDTLLKIEVIREEYYDQLIQPFQQRDMNVFSFSSFCVVCGASFPIKLDLIQIYENIDPDKKYKIIKNNFKILFHSVLTSFSFQLKYFFQDFVQHYYYVLKEELQLFKQNTNYQAKKQQITFFFIAAYFQSLKGENVMVDSKLQYKYSQLKNISFEQFNTQVQQIQAKFKIQSSIIIPSMTTVQHIYNSQLKKPIIGSVISANPELLTQLLIKKIPIYPELYQIDKFVAHFDSKISALSPELINGILNASSVDIMNRSSDVVKQYDMVKRNYGRHMERYSTYMTNKPFIVDSFIQKLTPVKFDPANFKDQFYKKYCPVSLQMHEQDVKQYTQQNNEQKEYECKDCKNINMTITLEKFKQHFYKINGSQVQVNQIYSEMWNQQVFPQNYSDKYLQNMAKQLQVSYFQIVNFGGFSYLDINAISKFQTLEQLVGYQVRFYNKISGIYVQSSNIEISQIPNDLKFVLSMTVNWNVFKHRLYNIIDKSQKLIQDLAQNQEVLALLTDFSNRCYYFKRKGSSNYFIDCQILVNYLFQYILPELQKHTNPQLLKLTVNQMMKDDILYADKYSELGAFRHKKHKEISAEKIFKQLKEYETINQESDNDNDYVEELTKKTLDDQNYED